MHMGILKVLLPDNVLECIGYLIIILIIVLATISVIEEIKKK